jgi:hypothetical protein
LKVTNKKMSLDEILANQKTEERIRNRTYPNQIPFEYGRQFVCYKPKKHIIPKIMLTAILMGAIATGAMTYTQASSENRINPIERTIQIEDSFNYVPVNKKGKSIKLKIDNNLEDFVYSPEPVEAKQLNQGIVVWEKIKEGEYEGRKISYPVGHLYVFKDINTRKIVGKFAVAGGVIGNDVESINNGVYVLNKFESWPDYMNSRGKVLYEGGNPENPWGYGRFYQYPITDKDSTLNLLSTDSFNRSIYPDKEQRYLHSCSLLSEGINGKEDYEKKKKELQETNFQPNRTIGCTKTSNYAMDFLEERVNLGIFRLAYVDNTKQ